MIAIQVSPMPNRSNHLSRTPRNCRN